MDREQVSSTRIASIGYDPEEQKLEIEFASDGSVYEYDDVTLADFNALKAASSVGRHFDAVIKGRYPYRRIE